MTAVQEQIRELEWRLNVQADPGIPPEVVPINEGVIL